ncbi:MAG: hypothetical protein COA57_04665 [Flavobacteriales bacterium]|nr:MAG: hypothetical protein COA57_04665 [Flavobacteriales bacterium]
MKTFTDNQIKFIRYAVFGYVLAVLLFRFYSNCLTHQLQQPVLKLLEADNTYWLLHYLQVPQILAGNHWLAVLFDGCLFLTAILSLGFAKNRFPPLLFWVLFAVYFITFHSYFVHHGHSLVGVIFITIPFFAKSAKSFSLLFAGVRFYTLFIYVSAAFWKIFRGSVFESNQMVNMLKEQNISVMINNPDSLQAGITTFFVNHPDFTFGLGMVAMLLQLFFIVGVFTRKFDMLLILSGIIFHLGTYILMDIQFWEIWILYITLIPWNKLSS